MIIRNGQVFDSVNAKFEKKDIMVAVIGALFCLKFIFITM